jgi:two-component system nitrogen regulation sensor histidine kinase NtrY
MFTHFFQTIKKYYISNKLITILAVAAIILTLTTYNIIAEESKISTPDPSKVIALILGDLIVFLILGILLTRKFFQNSFDDKHNNFKLQNRIIIAFSLVATVPTIIVSVFSAYFFNFGIQSWFDKKISTVLDQSIIVAESYITEHTLRLKETALSVSDDLSDMYYDLIHNSHLFTKALNAEAEMRSLDEAIVFQKPTNIVLAQTSLSFSLSFTNIPIYLIEKADRGEVVQIKSDPTKIRMLIKLKEHQGIYLLIGRLIDSKIIDHVDKTNGAAQQYYDLKNHILGIQIKFSIVFIFVALLLLLAAISWGVIFASQIVSPIRKLVDATERVKDGDLTAQVPEEGLKKDEIGILSSAFNRMIKQISRQQKDLVIAQRALAWSDVARRVAHEIKNPLTPIRLAAERLLRKFKSEVSDEEAFHKYTQTIIRHTDDINKIVAEFVNFARLPAPNFVSCELIELVRDMVESRKLLHDKITYNFSTNTQQINFVCDITQINQVMVNLLKNAEESLESRPLGPKIDISIIKDAEFVTVTITDNGPGFSAEIVEKATEAYITTKTKGTGLGLAIVKKIIQEHLGIIEIVNSEKGGAIIKLIFNFNELALKLK